MLRKKSIINEWVVSYALILLIPLITIFINYSYNTKIIRDEIMQAHELILNNLKDSIDRLMDEELGMFTTFYFDERIKSLVYSQEADSDFSLDAYKLIKELKSYSGGKLSYWLYIEEKDFIVNSTAAHHSYNIYNSQKLLKNEIPQYELWKEFLCEDYSNEFLFYDGLYTTVARRHLVYANSYSWRDTGRVNVFVTIPTTLIEEMVTSLPEGSILTIYLHRDGGNIERELLVIDSGGIAELPYNIAMDDVSEGEGIFELTDYIRISLLSDNEQATYSLLVPQDVFWEDSRYIRNVHLISLLATLLIGICLVIFLVRRNFRPVSSILDVIGKNSGEANEFEQIKSAYGVIRQENFTMKKTIESQEKGLIGSYLLSLLKGRVARLRDKEQQMGLGLSFQSDAFYLMGFYIPQREDGDMEFDELAFFVLDNILSELMEKEKFYQIEDGRFVFYLFCVHDAYKDESKEKSFKHAEFLCDFFEEKFKLQIIAAISTIEEDISQAKYMYQSVMEAFEYQKIIGGSGVITADELQEPDESRQFHLNQVMLEKALENGKLEEAYLVSESLFCNTGNMPFNVLRLRILENFLTVVNVYNKYIADSVKRMQLLSFLELLLNAETSDDLKQRFDEMLAFVSAKLSGQWEIEGQSLVEKIREYIESNYTDCNLNISSIAENMSRNPKYISKIYKEETGEGILDYLNTLRIRKAQEILLTRNVSVEEVSVMLGYTSTRTFRRSFAKITGMTPSKYLESN